MKLSSLCTIVLLLTILNGCTHERKSKSAVETKQSHHITVPKHITRTIKQDKNGIIWIAAFDGVFRYDGESFENIMEGISTARYFSILEDQKGRFWISSVGSGVFHYDGKCFEHFTTKDGLVHDNVTEIFEDSAGAVWFSTENGISKYDGQRFQNFIIKEGTKDNAVNAIVEDQNGNYWVGTRGNLYLYDGTDFNIVTHQNSSLQNVRSIIKDQEGRIWLGGNDGLWRYDHTGFTQLSQDFVGNIYEDEKGNILTSSSENQNDNVHLQHDKNNEVKNWKIVRYDKNDLDKAVISPTAVIENQKMLFGMLQSADKDLWFGSLYGINRFDGHTIEDFKQ
ncbi:ligand-binding sensor domain-containing protein [Sphingobacterium chungjuense]|uniref:ligand-binding sensor domain-containing protein n=1 Tax=Sphingobacterium chungjuense TaxID=2675553 RepID=UPI00140AB7B8|nr:two-component regulator propeller domain-containing protein [Sphingobacterium chungjuense]